MDTADFTTELRTFMRRTRRTPTELAQLTGLSIHTVGNWTTGKVRRPRLVSDILALARVLELDHEDTSALLRAADHPSLAQLQAQACQMGDADLSALLAPWDHPAIPPATVTPLPALLARYQLRAPVGDFVGRLEEIAQTEAALRQASNTGGMAAISAVRGMGGIGKTELAYIVAQKLRDTFPDAQIVLNLHGTSTAPLTPEQALQTVLRAFLPDTKLPEDLVALQALYRSQLDHKCVLILADDAASAAQVEPLLPPAGSGLLITSRRRLTLPAMTTIDLEQLPLADAIRLLRTICSRLTTQEAAALARACGYLPLALRVSGSLLHSIPALAVDDYLAQLADEWRRLSLLRDPDEPQRDVEAVLALSYVQLDPTTQAVFRQLGVFVADFATELAQRVVVLLGGGNLTSMLCQLQRRNLVMYEAQRERWRLHDLLRDLARQRLEAAGETEAAMWRYARAAVRSATSIQDQYLAGGDTVLVAVAQFDAERAHFDAARHWAQLHAQTPAGDQLLLDIARATLHIGSIRYDRRHESIPLWEGVRTAAHRLGDRLQEGRALGNLGIAYTQLGELHTATSYYEQHLTIARELGDRTGEGSALNNLGYAYYRLGEPSKAIDYNEQALVIARELGHRYGECETLGNLGNAYAELGDRRRAIDSCMAALSIAQAIGDRRQEGYILSYLARAQAFQGDIVQATTTVTQALVLLQEVGDRWGAAQCSWQFGLALAQHGEQERALPLLHAALAYEQEIGHARAEEHAALVAHLEAGEELPPELHIPTDQRAIGDG